MDANLNRRSELNYQIENRKEKIKDAAIIEFLKNGIENSKISAIAKTAGVGQATVYRYFETKPKLAVKCILKIWAVGIGKLFPEICHESRKNLSGFAKIKKFLNLFGSLFGKHPDMLRLLEQFDNYIIKENVPKEQLLQFKEGIIKTQSVMSEIIEQGKCDGSIRPQIDSDRFYMTATHSIITLSQKLLWRRKIMPMDAKKQILELIKMQLYYIKADRLK